VPPALGHTPIARPTGGPWVLRERFLPGTARSENPRRSSGYRIPPSQTYQLPRRPNDRQLPKGQGGHALILKAWPQLPHLVEPLQRRRQILLGRSLEAGARNVLQYSSVKLLNTPAIDWTLPDTTGADTKILKLGAKIRRSPVKDRQSRFEAHSLLAGRAKECRDLARCGSRESHRRRHTLSRRALELNEGRKLGGSRC
jgi:hypothetical protein